jgi:hypothetical protein
MRTQTIKFSEFMTGEYKQVTPKRKYGTLKKVATSTLLPFVVMTPKAFASEPAAAVPVMGSATQYIGEKSLSVIAHALDPLVQLMVALSFPIASVIMVGACFFFMFNNAEKAWSMIMRAGLGYVLIQLSPLFLKILQEVGNAI